MREGRGSDGVVSMELEFGVLTELSAAILALSVAATVFAGIVKGAVGFAMPLIMVSLIGSIMDPKFALAGVIVPIVFSNLLQTFRTGVEPAKRALQTYWRYILIVCIAIFAAAQLVPVIPKRVFYFVLGVPVVILALIQLAGVKLHIPSKHQAWSEWLIGTISGLLGGLAGTWGPTTVLYLLAINTPKAQQVVVQGVIYGMGSVTLLVAHLNSGILNAFTAPLSLMLLGPALIGMWLGFKVQDRLNQDQFRKVTLAILVIAGLNLLRLGATG
ncbi:MAG: sulfite exporter TauE/SafE family protein [Pseudomonadota bacterium]